MLAWRYSCSTIKSLGEEFRFRQVIGEPNVQKVTSLYMVHLLSQAVAGVAELSALITAVEVRFHRRLSI